MNWDKLSIYLCVRLITATLNEEQITTWDIAKEYFKDEEDVRRIYNGNSTRYLVAKSNLVYNRLKEMEKRGIVKIQIKNKVKTFVVEVDRIFLKKSRFMDNKLKEYLCVKDKSEKWDIFEL